MSAEKGIAGDKVFVVLTSNDGKFARIVQADTAARPDVNAHFKHSEMGAVGFEASLEFLDCTSPTIRYTSLTVSFP